MLLPLNFHRQPVARWALLGSDRETKGRMEGIARWQVSTVPCMAGWVARYTGVAGDHLKPSIPVFQPRELLDDSQVTTRVITSTDSD